MKYWRVIKNSLFIVSLVLTVCLGVCNVHAETTEELYDIYGVDLGGVARPKIDEAAEQVKSEIDRVEQIQKQDGWVNSAIESSRIAYESKKTEINEKVSSMMDNNLDMIYAMESGIYGEIDDLLRYDSAYKSNTVKINEVLRELDSYTTLDYFDRVDVDIDRIMAEYDAVLEQYKVAVDVFELGDVTHAEFPLNRERYVTSEFGNRVDPLNPGTYRYHAGVDLRAEVGTEVKSLFNGSVTGCGWSDTVGYWVRVSHGKNVRTFYCHLSELLCVEGQEVKQGDVIARSGATGTRCTGPHLHLGLYINGNAVNPDILFK